MAIGTQVINFCLEVFRHFLSRRKPVNCLHLSHLSYRYQRWQLFEVIGSEVFKLQGLFQVFTINSDSTIGLGSAFHVLSLLDIQIHSILSQPVLPSFSDNGHKAGVVGKYHVNHTEKHSQVWRLYSVVAISIHSMNSRSDKAEV